MEKYIHYNSVDFIEEESFIRWVNKNTITTDFDWDGWLDSNPEKREEVSKAINFIKNLRFNDVTIPAHTENKLWAGIKEGINSEEEDGIKKLKPRNTRRIIYAIAAAVLLFLVTINVLPDSYDTMEQTSFAENKKVLLPDGSSVELNSNTEIKFDTDSWEEERIVILKGEAFFDVQKGSKFTVETKKGSVEVLGTSFNVYSRKDNFSVLCLTGKVGVISKSINRVILPNQFISIKNDKEEFKEAISTVKNRSSWRSGLYQYVNTSLIEVVREMERQLNLTIQLPDELHDLKFSGSFDIKNKENILSEVLWPLGLKYKKEGRKVNVSEE